LDALSEAPFAAFHQQGHRFLLSASPERFLKREGRTLLSQPIKGTARRMSDAVEDERVKMRLSQSEKDRAENVMIVDLVRNDLSRIAAPTSVRVEELCGVHSFKTVHHLISSITAEMRDGASLFDVLAATFPMGSMTGAPKVSAMQIADALEHTNRGIYSGSIGYIDPQGHFDFNVVIRSLVYSRDREYVSCHVGGAITVRSHWDHEYDECLLKAEAVRSALRAE
jgi:para-aminobenzoate synthetase component 1